MTSRELQVLNAIDQLGGQASVGAISKKTALSLDYTHELAKGLLRQHYIDQPASRILALGAKGRSLMSARSATMTKTAVSGLAEAAHLISRQTDRMPALPPETNFLSPGFMEEPISFIKHDLNKNQTVELEHTRSIQAGVDGLISIHAKRLQRKIKVA